MPRLRSSALQAPASPQGYEYTRSPTGSVSTSLARARKDDDALWLGQSLLRYGLIVIITSCCLIALLTSSTPVSILLVNAVAVLSEDRFLARSELGPLCWYIQGVHTEYVKLDGATRPRSLPLEDPRMMRRASRESL